MTMRLEAVVRSHSKLVMILPSVGGRVLILSVLLRLKAALAILVCVHGGCTLYGAVGGADGVR